MRICAEEGYEFAVSKAEVLYRYDEKGKQLEPMERAIIDVPEEFSGTVIDKLSQRKRRTARVCQLQTAVTPDLNSPFLQRSHRLPR